MTQPLLDTNYNDLLDTSGNVLLDATVAKYYMPINLPTCLQTIIKAYVYTQYQDDDDILAFNDAFNTMAQQQLDFLNNLNLPVYPNAIIAGELLDWVGQGLYGIPRPTISLGEAVSIGPLNTWLLNELELNGTQDVGNLPYLIASDDVYKRILTWHHYRGDGRQFSIPWLKKRVARFLFCPNGTDLNGSSLNAVSIDVSGSTFTIRCPTAVSGMYAIFGALVKAQQLELPFQYSYVVA